MRLALILAALALTACGSKQPAQAPAQLVVSIGLQEPRSLLPANTQETNGQQVLRALFTGLVEYDSKLEPVAAAAESITSADNRTWTIKLKPDWKFHNGEAVTADSYINAWNAGAWGPNAFQGNSYFEKIEGYAELNPADAKQAPLATKLKGLVKKDDLSFEVTLREPYVNFRSMLGHNVFLPLPRAAFTDVARNAVDPAFNESPVGQGPFRMAEPWKHDELIRVVRNEQYAGATQPRVAGIDFRVYQHLTTQYQDLLAGRLDIVPVLPVQDLAQASSDLGARYKQSQATLPYYLFFPTFEKRYANPAIRKAISMAIDRTALSHAIYQDTARPLRAFVAPVPGYRSGICGDACDFDPQKARELFESAGGAKAVGGRIQVSYIVDGDQKPATDAVCNQIRKVLQVTCAVNPLPRFSDMIARARARQPIGLFRFSWVLDYPVIENYLQPLFAANGPANFSGYNNPEFDALLAAGDRAATPAAALASYQQAEDILVRDMPAIPLVYSLAYLGHSTRVTNVEVDAFRHVRLLELAPAAQ